jgi:hypothetical protein
MKTLYVSFEIGDSGVTTVLLVLVACEVDLIYRYFSAPTKDFLRKFSSKISPRKNVYY